jgi:hypothetical protein
MTTTRVTYTSIAPGAEVLMEIGYDGSLFPTTKRSGQWVTVTGVERKGRHARLVTADNATQWANPGAKVTTRA